MTNHTFVNLLTAAKSLIEHIDSFGGTFFPREINATVKTLRDRIADVEQTMIDKSPRQEVFNAIDREREYQNRKWSDNPHSLNRWIQIIEKELVEAKRARRHPDEAKRELLQVASVIVACLEQHGVVERECEHDWYKCLAKSGSKHCIEVLRKECGRVILIPCEHDWFISSTAWGPRHGHSIVVYCAKCDMVGFVYHPSTHEFQQAEVLSITKSYRWYEPDRVVIKE